MYHRDIIEIIATFISAEEHALIAPIYGLKNTFEHADWCVDYRHPLRSVRYSAPFILDLIHPTEWVLVYSTYVDGKLVKTKLERNDNVLFSIVHYNAGIIHKMIGPACIIYRMNWVISHYVQFGMYINDAKFGDCIRANVVSAYAEKLSITDGVLSNVRYPPVCDNIMGAAECPGCRFGGIHIRS